MDVIGVLMKKSLSFFSDESRAIDFLIGLCQFLELISLY